MVDNADILWKGRVFTDFGRVPLDCTVEPISIVVVVAAALEPAVGIGATSVCIAVMTVCAALVDIGTLEPVSLKPTGTCAPITLFLILTSGKFVASMLAIGALVFWHNVQLCLNAMFVHETRATGVCLAICHFTLVVTLFLPPSVDDTLRGIVGIGAIGPIRFVKIIVKRS